MIKIHENRLEHFLRLIFPNHTKFLNTRPFFEVNENIFYNFANDLNVNGCLSERQIVSTLVPILF
jgi:hypothetical protein